MPSGSPYNFSQGHHAMGAHCGVPISVQPLSALDLGDEEEVLNWLKKTSNDLSDYYQNYRGLYRENIARYVGDAPGSYNSEMWNGQSFVYQPNPGRKELNVIQPIVEAHLARIISSRANVSVLPIHSNEFNDLAAAKNAEQALKQSFEQRKINDKMEAAARTMLICGMSYVVVEWDEQIGPPIAKRGEQIQAVDEEGEPILDEDGEPMMLAPNIRMGDVNYKILRPDQVLEAPGEWGESVDWVITTELRDVHRLRQLYPSVAGEIKPGIPSSSFEHDLLMAHMQNVEHQALVYTLYHRATPEFPDGWQIRATGDVILESGPLPYPSLNEYGVLPIERVHDTLVPGYDLPLPMTVMEAGKAHSETFNRIDKVLRKDMSLSVPKWVVHQLSGTNKNQLNPLSNYVSYKGSPDMTPRLIRPSATSSEYFAYRDKMLQELQVNTGVANLLNKPPPNTRAASMLQHLEEQEFTRAEPLIRHMNDFMSRLGRISVAIMADKYKMDPNPEARLIKLSGGKGPTSFIRLEVADLMGPYDIKYERTSALPESKQGRLNEAARMLQMGVIDMQTYKKIINFSSDPDLESAEDKAFEKQLLENDLLMRGHQVEPPLEWEDHVEHLRALYPVIQSIEFAEAPPELKQGFIAHCMAHEMFAWQRAQISLRYAIKVEQYVKWLFFSALPSAIPVAIDNPATPAADDIMQARLTTSGLSQPDAPLEPGPSNPDAV